MCYAVDLTTQPNIDYQQYPGRMEAKTCFPTLSGRAVLLRDRRRQEIVSGRWSKPARRIYRNWKTTS